MVGVWLLYVYLDCIVSLESVISSYLCDRRAEMKQREKKDRDKA